MRFLTVEEVVAAASTMLPNTPSKKDRDVMKFWVWQAEKQIGCSKFNLKRFEIDFINCIAKKPSDHIHTSELAILDAQGNDLQYVHEGYRARAHPVTAFNNPIIPKVYEDEYSFKLDSNATHVDRAVGRYWAYPVDDDNNPLIPEQHLEAIMNYVSYSYAKNKGDALGRIDYYNNQWKIQAAKARGQNKMPDVPEARTILNRWMTLIPDMYNLSYGTY